VAYFRKNNTAPITITVIMAAASMPAGRAGFDTIARTITARMKKPV